MSTSTTTSTSPTATGPGEPVGADLSTSLRALKLGGNEHHPARTPGPGPNTQHGSRRAPAACAIDGADLAIAATVIRTGSHLLTRNVRHFPMFPGLQAPY